MRLPIPPGLALQLALRVALTLLLALAAAVLCVWLQTPLPWMLGPLLATALASVLGCAHRKRGAAAQRRPVDHRHRAGPVFHTPGDRAGGGAVVGHRAGHRLGARCWAGLFGPWLQRVNAHRLPQVPAAALRATTYFSGAIGGASEMTLLAERGARAPTWWPRRTACGC